MAKVFRRTYKDKNGKKKKTKKYYGHITNEFDVRKRVSLCSDKDASETMLREKQRKADRMRAGDVSPFDEHRRTPLVNHLADFIQSLRDAGRSPEHYKLIESRCRTIIESCKFRFIGDISASRVQSALAELSRSGKSDQTVRHYLRAIKQFSRWLVRDRRTDDDRLAHLEYRAGKKVEQTFERRELSSEEIHRLLKAALQGGVCYKLTGEQRFLLYSTALGTGLRAQELGYLTPRHFDLDGEPATVRIEADEEKAGRGAVLPIPPDLVEAIRSYLAELPP